MAPKSKSKREELKQEDILQAVLIADSFNAQFAPMSSDKPRMLLPLCNVPMLDYALDFLVAAGVQEVFVFCTHLADQIRSHIRNSKWSEDTSPCTVIPVLSEGCLSLGEALREIDLQGLIKSDFVLMYGDTVSNVKLKSIIEEHKKRREKDKNMVMSMVFKKCAPSHPTRCRSDDIFLAVEQPSNKILHFQRPGYKKKLEIPAEVLLENDDVQVRYDLLDCQISICSPQVPQLFTDNFDYQTRDDFVKGILINEEIMGNSIYLNVVNDEYAVRISNLQMYDTVSRDIISRWSYPFVPDNMQTRDKQHLSFGRMNVYTSKDITLARGCKLQENVIVGSGTSMGRDTIVSHSVIGSNCKIGDNVKITGCYIWDNVTVENNCNLTTALLCDNVYIYDGCTVQPGCVLSWGIKIGPSIELPIGTILQSTPPEDDFVNKDESANSSKGDIDLGEQSEAFIYQHPSTSDDEDEEELIQDMWGLNLQSDESQSEASSINLDAETEEDEDEEDDKIAFYSELIDTFRRSKEMNISTENLIVEINSLKHPYNIHITDLQGAVLRAAVELPMMDNPGLNAAKLLLAIKKHIVQHLKLLKNYIKGRDSQMNCLQALGDFAAVETKMLAVLPKVLHLLYEEADLLSEEAIISWYKSLSENDHSTLIKQVSPLIKWFEEAEEESSEEDSN